MSNLKKSSAKSASKGASKGNVSKLDVDDAVLKYTKGVSNFEQLGERWLMRPLPAPEVHYKIWITFATLIAAATRLYRIALPKEVVFDEVHFGKFASYYLQRTYFFDLHPPFAKMMIAFIGYLSGYDGSFKFEEIGMSYETHPAPFIAYRTFNAILGILTVPIMFQTLKELNFRAITCCFGAILIAADNAHITETRLILLDSILVFAVTCTFYCYVRFYKAQLRSPFSWEWYTWLYLTGLSLSFVISTKYVGVMTYAAIGIPVAFNLWQLLDVRAGLSLRTFVKHFGRRLNALVLVPFVIYLFWFWVHFSILNTSGPGDAFMSAEFQDTLFDSEATSNSKQVNYYDIVTFKHKDTSAFLHSHEAFYPLRYEDGRVSSQGQQVTGYSHEDANNEWEILPVKELPEHTGQPVLLNDHIRLRHIVTGNYLLAHDVASPLYPTNEEVTAVNEEEANGENYKETLFVLQPLISSDSGHKVKSLVTGLRIVHVDTSVALWTHNDVLLPDWGFGQQEVNGNKKIIDSENDWFIDSILNLDDSRKQYIPKVVKPMPFLRKWFELQRLMFEHNNKLSSEHPFASSPQSWPIATMGVSFWTKETEKRQIYYVSNIIAGWIQVISMGVFVGIVVIDLVTRQRSVFIINKITREKLYGPVAFFFIGWCCHFFPFFLMGRQLFLHHYLPAQVIASMFSAALWETLFSYSISLDITKDEEAPGAAYENFPKVYSYVLGLFYLICTISVLYFFYSFSPLIYGTYMEPAEVASKQWFNIKLNFSK